MRTAIYKAISAIWCACCFAAVIAIVHTGTVSSQSSSDSNAPDHVVEEKRREAKRLLLEAQSLVSRPDAASIRRAAENYEKSAAIQAETGFPKIALQEYNIAGVIWGEQLDERARQIEAYKKALTLAEKMEDDPTAAALSYLNLGSAYAGLGEPDTAIKYYEAALGVLAQQNGAKAVLATLWPVADESTSLLMSEFYRFKKDRPEMTKSGAIREAQKAMIDGKLTSSGPGGGCRGPKVFKPGQPQPAAFKCDPNAPFSHPYFWAPFVLIGNWR